MPPAAVALARLRGRRGMVTPTASALPAGQLTPRMAFTGFELTAGQCSTLDDVSAGLTSG